MSLELINQAHLITDPRTGKQYRIDFDKKLGEGSYGAVYVAHQVNPELHDELIVKVFTNPQNAGDLKAEAELLKKSYKHVAYFVGEQNKHYLVMEKIPGINLYDLIYKTPEFKEFAFAARVKLFRMLAHDLVNNIHAPRLRGKSLIHADTKPKNVVVDADLNQKSVKDARFVDYGSALGLNVKNRDRLIDNLGVAVTTGYIAPETVEGQIGVRSDLRALGAIALQIFGADIFKDHTLDDKTVISVDFSFDNLFVGIPGFPERLRDILTAFFKKMTKQAYYSRATDEEVLKFAELLDSYCVAEASGNAEDCFERLDVFVNSNEFFVREDHLPRLPENVWKKFQECPAQRPQLAQAIAKNIYAYPTTVILEFFYYLSREGKSCENVENALIESINCYEDRQVWNIYRKLDSANQTKLLLAFKPKTLGSKIDYFFSVVEKRIPLDAKIMTIIKDIAENFEECTPKVKEEFRKKLIQPLFFFNLKTSPPEIFVPLWLYFSKKENKAEVDDTRFNQLAARVAKDQAGCSTKNILKAFRQLDKHGMTKQKVELSKTVTAVLENHVKENKPRYFTSEGRAARKLTFALKDSFFFKGRRRKILKAALKGTDADTAALVEKLSIPAKAA